MSNNANKDMKYDAIMKDNGNLAKLVTEHKNITVGENAIPRITSSDYIASLSSNFNGWSFRANGYLNQVFEDPNKISGMMMLANHTKWAPEEGWTSWIEARANQGDIARMMRTHSKIVVSHSLVGGDMNVRTMLKSDLDKILFSNKFLDMHLDWNVYGYTVAEPVFSKKDPEREKLLALQRIYKVKPVANQGGNKLTSRMPGGVEPTTQIPYSTSNISADYTSSNYANTTSVTAKSNPYPWIETSNVLPIKNEDTSNDDIKVTWDWHIVDLLILNPMSIRICRNNLEDTQYLRSKFGNGRNDEWSAYVNSTYCDSGNGAYIIAYVQYPFNEQGMDSILFYPHELIFIPRYASHSYPDGVSQLREAYKEIIQRDILEESMIATAKRWGDPIMKISLDRDIWQKRDLRDNILEQIRHSRSVGMDMILPEGVDVGTIESSGGVDLINGPLEYIQNKVNKIMQWADSFTESDSSNRSLGDVQLAFMEIDSEPERNLFANVYYKCIFLPLVIANGYNESDCPFISFDPINPKDVLEWGNFYSGLIEYMDSGQMNQFFEFVEMPFTTPIVESPREKEEREYKEEREQDNSNTEDDIFSNVGNDSVIGDEFTKDSNVGSDTKTKTKKFPSPFNTPVSKNTLDSVSDDFSSDGEDISEEELPDSVDIGDIATNPGEILKPSEETQLSARRRTYKPNMSNHERDSYVKTNDALKQSHKSHVSKFANRINKIN